MASAKIEAPVLGKTSKIELDPAVFGETFNGTLVHEVVRAERNAKRSGNASTKRRGEVAMTGAKAWRQKGTGRARVGALSAGHRKGGGVTFGPKPRNYVFKVNRKARRKALRAALSLHAGRGTLAIVESGSFADPATKIASQNLTDWQDTGSVVLLTAGTDERNLALSFRNIGRVRAVLTPEQLGVYELTAAQNLVISKDALDSLSNLASTEITRESKKPVLAHPAGKTNPTGGIRAVPKPKLSASERAANAASAKSGSTSPSSDAPRVSDEDGAPAPAGDGSSSDAAPGSQEDSN
ncbi:MAG: 50S ribosomal protein L4 [Solirubrobacterales bacterium]